MKLSPALFLLSLCLAFTTAARADAPTIPLWPEGVPGLRADAGPEKVVDGRITNIHTPTLTVFCPPPEKANRTGVIMAPGGGYVRLGIGERGGPITEWLNSLGVTVFVLKYRLAEYGHPAPLQDMMRAIRLVRRDAAQWQLDPHRIGVFGASAGGHLSACASTLFDHPVSRTGHELDAVSARPDFAILVYPVITMEPGVTHGGSRKALLGEAPAPDLEQLLSLEKQVHAQTPPTLLIATMADKAVPVENTLRYYQALRTAGVPAEMHVYGAGNHGNSLDPAYGPTALWPQRGEEWLRFNGWIP